MSYSYVTWECPKCGVKIPEIASGSSVEECPECPCDVLVYAEIYAWDADRETFTTVIV